MSSFERTTNVYRATLKEEWEALTNYYKDDNVNGILPMTLARDTALHIAVYSGTKKPLEDLLIGNPLINDAMMIKNAYGFTALHEAAVTGNFEAVRLLVSYNPQLLLEWNKAGETPLMTAAAFGKRKIVTFLASYSEPNQMTADKKLISIHRHRQTQKKHTDKIGTADPHIEGGLRATSILHAAVLGEHFGTALELLRLDKSLGGLKDESCMTCLQLLASMPSAFKSGYRVGILESILYFCLPIYEDFDDDEVMNGEANIIHEHLTHSARSISLSIWRLFCLGSPMIKRMWKAKRTHKFAVKLAEELIKEDISWEEKNTIGVEENDEKEQAKEESQEINTEIPLLLATKNGIVEIVKEILNQYPQAVEHRSHKGQNMLHMVFKHRQKEILDHIKTMAFPMIWLARMIDNNGCTILHHAAELDTKGTRPGPALQLQAELKWFRRAQKYIPTYYERYEVGKKNAERIFKENHKDQLQEAQKWIKETSQSCSTVAVLIATVVFAAAYTVPGGSNDLGIPVFLHSPFFLFFTMMDVVSLASSLTSVVMFLSILTSPCEQQDFLYSLPRKLSLGFTLLFFSVATTMLTFAATIILIIRLNQRQWTATLIYVAAFFPVTVFALMQFPLYAAFLGTLKVSLKRVGKLVTRPFGKRKISLDMV